MSPLSDSWQEMLEAARSVDQRYQDLDRERLGRIWSTTEFLAACSTDWGELVEEIMKWEGIRPGEADKEAIEHELADMLWALIVLSDRLDIDLRQALLQTMQGLHKRLDNKG